MPETLPELNPRKLQGFGARMLAKFGEYKNDRKVLEHQWLKHMRQFRGVIDPEIKARLLEDQSTAYPKVTRTKVINTLARLMEMLFPNTMKNWEVTPGKVPDIPKEDLDALLAGLQANLPEGEELTDEIIENEIMKFAQLRAERMTVEMEDQLGDIGYTQLVRKIIFSGILYSAGILKGPLVRTVPSRTWSRQTNGTYKAQDVRKKVPYFSPVSIWDWYPDLSAKTLDKMDGTFQRHIMNRAQVKNLAKRPDFLKDQILTWLNNHVQGNFIEQHWETELRSSGDKSNVTDISSRKYELAEWWGLVDAADLRAAGVKLPDGDNASMFTANVWIIDNVVIKATLHPMAHNNSMYHVFIYEEDDISLLGTGLPNIMRDSQLGICEAARMVLDNSSVVTGPMLEIDHDRLVGDQDPSIHAYKIFWTEGEANNNKPAVREIKVDAHINELSAVVSMFMDFADMETALPPPAMGDVTQGGSEALRTTRGASMLMGAASLPIRDTVRNFDRFTTSTIRSLYDWNMEFNKKESIKGDFNVQALASSSLIAKEVRAHALNEFRASLDEDEKVFIDKKKMLIERMEANDVPKDILAEDDVVRVRQKEQADALAEQQALATARVEAEVKKILTDALKNVSLARKADVSSSTDVVEVLLKGIESAISKAEPEPTQQVNS